MLGYAVKCNQDGFITQLNLLFHKLDLFHERIFPSLREGSVELRVRTRAQNVFPEMKFIFHSVVYAIRQREILTRKFLRLGIEVN